MNYEQKYKEALKRAKAIISGEIVEADSTTCEYIFPELKESEDEKIRRVLIDYFNRYKEQDECGVKTFYGIPTGNILAWLEKQGETSYNPYEAALKSIAEMCERETYANGQDLQDFFANVKVKCKEACEYQQINSVTPKYKVGDWLISVTYGPASPVKVLDVFNNHYRLESIYGSSVYPEIRQVYEYYRLWTIEDAKEGDVLIDTFNSPFIYAGCADKYAKCYIVFYTNHEYSGLTDFSSPQNWEDKNYVHPATKEQCDLLFSKMKEAGYKWNAETKQITKEESTDKEEQLDADIDLYYQTYGNGHNAFDGLSLEKFRDIVKQFVEDYK